MPVTILHIDYALADDLGDDGPAWIASLIGIPDWPGDDFALLHVADDSGERTYLATDIEWVRMLASAQQAGTPVDVPTDVAAEKLLGWKPGDAMGWLGL